MNSSRLPFDIFNGYIQAKTIKLDLRIIFDQDEWKTTAPIYLMEETIKDLRDVYSQIKIEYNISWHSGTGTELDKSGWYNKIEKGAKEGSINVFLFENKKSYKYMSKVKFPACQIFFSKGSTKSDKFSSGALAHEIAHLLLDFAGFGIDADTNMRVWTRGTSFEWVGDLSSQTKAITGNITQDTQLETANSFARNGLVVYGESWVDDYRIDPRTGTNIVSHFARTPTILDLYRVGALVIEEGQK